MIQVINHQVKLLREQRDKRLRENREHDITRLDSTGRANQLNRATHRT